MAYKLISLDKIPSTQNYAQDLIARGGGADHIAIVAKVQTAGRGRYRRNWVSPSGNLYASFIFKSGDRNPLLSYSVAVAIAETILSFGVVPTIKWPNDILIDGKKVSGTLIEYAGDFVVIGIGINIKSNPRNLNYETARLNKYTKTTSDEVLARLMKSLDIWMKRDFAQVRERWLDMSAHIDKQVIYRGKAAEFMGLNDDGAMILRNGSEYFFVFGDELS